MMRKQAIKTPINKKDDILYPVNYHPISITPWLSKILRKILHKRVTIYLKIRELISLLQLRFCQMIFAQDDILFSLNQSNK